MLLFNFSRLSFCPAPSIPPAALIINARDMPIFKLYPQQYTTAAGSSLIWTRRMCRLYNNGDDWQAAEIYNIYSRTDVYSSSTGSFASAWHLATPFCFPSVIYTEYNNARRCFNLPISNIFVSYFDFSVLFILFVCCISCMETFNCVTLSNQRWH